MNRINEILDNIDNLRHVLDAHRPLPDGLVRNLRDVMRVEWTYNTNALEGNTLNLLETKMVVEDGLTIGGKTMKEHLEAVNHAKAIDYVIEMVSQNKDISDWILRQIHYIVLVVIDDENAGKYRSFNVEISGSKHKPIDHVKVRDEMKELFRWYRRHKDILHPVKLASEFHFRLVYIHPFSDGNGRTARLMMNMILMQHGFPPTVIKAENENRKKYYETLETASVYGELNPFTELIAECVEEGLKKYLNALGV